MASISSFRRESLMGSSVGPFVCSSEAHGSDVVQQTSQEFFFDGYHGKACDSSVCSSISGAEPTTGYLRLLHSPQFLIYYRTGNTEILFQSVGYLNRWAANLAFSLLSRLFAYGKSVQPLTRANMGYGLIFVIRNKILVLINALIVAEHWMT